jgi:short-subunit dehydrogenase involved in D-alanine esterification of teichoic acids
MHQELNTNFTSVVNLTMKFLPHLVACEGGASVIYTGSNLAWVPATTLPMYSSSKAALSAFILCLRDQLRTSSVKVIEVSPPLVRTELHDYMGSEKGRSLGIPVQEFTKAAYAGLAEGKDQIIVGAVGPPPFNETLLQTFNEIVDKRRSVCAYLANMLRGEKESL